MLARIVRAEENSPFKASGRENDGSRDLFVLDVLYKMGLPLHIHTAPEDTFYVVDGVPTAQLDDEVLSSSRETSPPPLQASPIPSRMTGPTNRLGW